MKKPLLYAVISIVAVLTLTACGPPKAFDIHYGSDLQKYPNLVRQNTVENYDEFKKQTWITGPRLGASGRYQYLRALADGNNSVGFIQLYVYRYDGGHDGYDFHSAYDLNGQKLEVVKIRYEKDWTENEYWYEGELRHDIIHFTVDEAAVTLKYQDLIKHRNSGLSLKVYGQRANLVIEIPGVYIDDYLGVLEERYNLKGLK